MADNLNHDGDDIAMKSYLDPTLMPAALEVVVSDDTTEIQCSDEDQGLQHDDADPAISTEFKVDYDQQQDITKGNDEDQEDSVSGHVCYGETHSMETVHCLPGMDDPAYEMEPLKIIQSSHSNNPSPKCSESQHTDLSLAKIEPALQTDHSSCISVESGSQGDGDKQLAETLKTIAKHEHETTGSTGVTVVHPAMLSGVRAYACNRAFVCPNRPPYIENFLRWRGHVSNTSGLLPMIEHLRPSAMILRPPGHVSRLDSPKHGKVAPNTTCSSSQAVTAEGSLNLEDTLVPDVVAMETVVTTDATKKQTVTMANNFAAPVLSAADQSLLAASHAACSTALNSVAEAGHGTQHYESAMSEATRGTSNSRNILEVTIANMTKRERDKLKKREQRKCSDYREREKLIARERMRRVRENTSYRDTERLRDRIRRQQSRLNDPIARQIERERDKQNKRIQRLQTSGGHIVPVVSLQEVTDELIF